VQEDDVRIFSRTADDRRRFRGRLAELPDRFRVEIHAFELMDNHYHALLRSVDLDLSRAVP
jgi:REP element-mobilizing transposase RayT